MAAGCSGRRAISTPGSQRGGVAPEEPAHSAGWLALLQQLVDANGGGEQYVYLQLSRGAEFGRNHAPLPDIAPTVFAYCSPWPVPSGSTLRDGLACITAEDTRWARCDIKSVALLANVLLRQQAVDAGASETILLRAGELIEGSASTVHVVRGGTLITPPNSTRLLPGTTRSVVEELADQLGIARRDARISEAELRSADEIWLGAATREVQTGHPPGWKAGGQWPAWTGVAPDLRRLPATQARDSTLIGMCSSRATGAGCCSMSSSVHWSSVSRNAPVASFSRPPETAGRRNHAVAAALRQALHHAQFGFHVAHHCADADVARGTGQAHAATLATQCFDVAQLGSLATTFTR